MEFISDDIEFGTAPTMKFAVNKAADAIADLLIFGRLDPSAIDRMAILTQADENGLAELQIVSHALRGR